MSGFSNEIANLGDYLSGPGTVSLITAATTPNTLTLGGDGNSSTFSGGITQTAPGILGAVTKVGAGALTLKGVGLSNYSGNTTINAGSIKAGNAVSS